MSALEKLSVRIKQKGLRRTMTALWGRYVFFHRELLWMERDLASPVPPQVLKPYPPVRFVQVDMQNADAFAKYFGDRVNVMRELAAEGHIGHMYVDEQGDAIGMIWASTRDYYDRHHWGCTFPVKAGECFGFCAEMTRPYFGTSLSIDGQVHLWKVMRELGCTRLVSVCEPRNIPALKAHLRMGYQEQGRVRHVYDLFGRWRLFRETRYSGSRLERLRKAAPASITASA